MRSNFDGSVYATGSRTTNHQRHFFATEIFVFLHFASDVLHFFQRRGYEARQANHVSAFFFSFGQNFVARDHHAHIDHIKVVALQDDGDDVFANVVHIAFDCGDHDLAFGFHILAGLRLQAFFFFDVRHQMRHGLLHHARGLHHLRQKHLALAKQIAHYIHAVHQRAFDHMQRSTALFQNLLISLFGVVGNEFSDAVYQCVA